MMKQRWGLDRNVLRTISGDPWDVKQHHWNTGGKENQQLNPANLNLKRSKSLVISPLWVRASLGSYVRQAKFCLLVVWLFILGISLFRPTLQLTRLKMSEIILTGRNPQIKNENCLDFTIVKGDFAVYFWQLCYTCPARLSSSPGSFYALLYRGNGH